MAKKHGFRGTPVRPSNRPGTMGRVFETRGDPLVSPRQGQEDFGRNIETENPDYDRLFAPLARDLLKPEQVDKTSALRKLSAKQSYDPQRKAAQILLETRAKVARAEKGAQELRIAKRHSADGVMPDNIPATVLPHEESPSREKQTPQDVGKKQGFYDFSGKNPPKEIKKHGKIYRRK